MEINWKAKLTSRKFWAAVVSFVALLVVALGGTEAQATQITALIMAGATVIAYIVGEGMIDAASAGAATIINNTSTVGQQATVPPAETLDGKTDAPAAIAPQTGAEGKASASDTTDTV